MQKINLRFELLSSLVHTEETNSNIATIYREKILRDGEIHNIPAVHGNALRGCLRNLGANHMLETIGMPKNSVKLNIFHVLFSGGSLENMEAVVDINYKQQIREVCPFISLFGAAMGNEMLKGKMMVSSLLPECKELGTGGRSYRDMTSIVRYTRQDDAKGEVGDTWLSPEREPKKQQMFYDIEVLNMGNVLNGTIRLDTNNEIEISCFYAILNEFTKKPFIGGSARVGHGEVRVTIEGAEDNARLYTEWLLSNASRIQEWITKYN